MKRTRLPVAAALALSCVLLCGQASAASLTGLDLSAAYLADTDAENLASETAFLNDAAQRFKLGGRCDQVELFDLDSAHYSYPGSAQVGALTAVTAAFKAGGYAVQALGHDADAEVTDDFFLATRGELQVLGNVYGNDNDASLEWCSLTAAAATPGARRPVPQPVPQIGTVTPAPAAAQPAPQTTFQTLRTPDGFSFTLQGCQGKPRASGELYQGEKFAADVNTEVKCTFSVTNDGKTDQDFKLYAGDLTEAFDDLANELPAVAVQIKDSRSPYVANLFVIQGLSIQGAIYFYASSSAQTIKKLSLYFSSGRLEYRDVPIRR